MIAGFLNGELSWWWYGFASEYWWIKTGTHAHWSECPKYPFDPTCGFEGGGLT